MDKKLLLIQAITLMFRESQLDDKTLESSNIVRPIAESVALPEVSIGLISTERDVMVGLKVIILDMCDHVGARQFEAIDLLQKVKYICRDDDVLFAAFSEGVSTVLEQDQLKRLCLSIRENFKAHAEELQIQTIVQEAATELRFNRDKIKNIHQFVQGIQSKLEPFQTRNDGKDPAIVGTASSDDPEGMEKEFSTARELNDDRGIMRTGWQGLNRMLQGGIRRGETFVWSALQHNFKTGFGLSLFKHIALYNVPYMIDPKKKPLLLHISFENALALNMPFMYRNIFENKTGFQADLQNKTPKELSDYVRTELSATGYETRFIHVNPSMWTYMDICNYIVKLETQGYEIHLAMLDYAAMINKAGCDNTGPMGAVIRDLFRRLRNFFSARKIAFGTPHQMSVDAKLLIRNGLEDTLVKEVANKGYYDGCKTIDQEVDLELYMHKVIAQDGKAYLTMQRGKHRLINLTAAEYLYCVLPFEMIGDIRDDVNGADTTRKKPGHGPMGSKDAVPFWDLEKQEDALAMAA